MAKTIMVQGTMSSAGKSLITAGLCRIFSEDGYRTAPFKAQNMALNSFISSEGLEMGRAQVVQAEAAGVEPSVLMNPVLLKPTGDMKSQVIVQGKVYGNFSAKEYYALKKGLIPAVRESFEKLSSFYDLLVIEGAGSPAEINLAQDDFVNMGMAEIADAPVLLVGDIDRGGVFAQLYGTLALLKEQERARVKALIINKFRGDQSILDPGIRMLEELTGLPCAGVVPWMKVSLDEEDSQASKLQEKERPEEKGGLDLAVIRLNHLSNFTDFGPLELLEGASVRYVQDPRKLGTPDLILLPGSKNTMGDLRALRESGMEGRILAAQRKGIPIFGICGGFQMLGEKISDPEGAEGGGEIRGMGLLPIETVFSGEKIRSRVDGHFLEVGGIFQKLSGLCFSGYEMHMGESFRKSGAALTEISRQMGDQKGSPDGNAKALIQEGTSQGNVYGSYVHGIFDSEAVLEALSEALVERKGGGYARMHKVQNLARFREQQFQELASVLRKSLDLDLIYHILEGSGQSAPGPKADGKLIKT